MRKNTLFLAGLIFLGSWISPDSGFAENPTPERQSLERKSSGKKTDYTELSLEDLMNVKVTSVSKKEQNLFDAAAAIHVISSEEIRRSGATNLPELLRLVPGVDVARINGYLYAVSIRGFNDQFANKLLVLLDGRSIYSNVTSGVFWHQQDVVLEDIDRIEVIRGPGGTLWGANAVNGVINIVRKKSQATQGILVSAGGGSKDRGFATLRYGGKIGETTSYRVFGQFRDRDQNLGQNDSSGIAHTGLRFDFEPSEKDQLVVQGDYNHFRGDRTSTFPDFLNSKFTTEDYVMENVAANALTRWSHRLNDHSDFNLQLYYDYYRAENISNIGNISRAHTLDFDFQHRLAFPRARQELLYGMEYRVGFLGGTSARDIQIGPQSSTDHLVSGFLQDEVRLIPNRLILTLGSKFEHNSRSGFEYQPSARLLLKIHPQHSLWASVSRVVRTPSKFDNDLQFNYQLIPPQGKQPPVWVTLLGNKALASERLIAIEGGYRAQPHRNVTVDVTGFFNIYRDLVLYTAQGKPGFSPQPIPHVQVNLRNANDIEGNTYGVEASLGWKPLSWWQLRTNYAYHRFDLKTLGGQGTPESIEGRSPRHQMAFFSRMDLPYNLELDFGLRFVDELSRIQVPSYITGEARLAWRPKEGLEFAIVGQNLFQRGHSEFQTIDIGDRKSFQIERNIYGKFTWRWK